MSKKSAYSKFEDERSVVKSILPKADGKIWMRRLLMILIYVAYVSVWLVLGIMLRLVAPLMALMLVTECILIFFTWRYTKIEYELTIHEGMLGFAVIYGGLSRKPLFSCRVHDLKVIAPYEGKGREEADAYAADRRLVYVSDIDSIHNYYAVYEPEGGEKTLLVFETEEKTLKMLKYYNSEAFRAR